MARVSDDGPESLLLGGLASNKLAGCFTQYHAGLVLALQNTGD